MKSRLPVGAAALWWGSLTTIGFLVVPLLFAQLPEPAMAGGLAARLFGAQTWVSCICAMLLLVLSRPNVPQARAAISQDTLLFIVSGMLLALLSEFAVAPQIMTRENLRFWHSLGSAMYLLQWICAGATLWKLTPPQD